MAKARLYCNHLNSLLNRLKNHFSTNLIKKSLFYEFNSIILTTRASREERFDILDPRSTTNCSDRKAKSKPSRIIYKCK